MKSSIRLWVVSVCMAAVLSSCTVSNRSEVGTTYLIGRVLPLTVALGNPNGLQGSGVFIEDDVVLTARHLFLSLPLPTQITTTDGMIYPIEKVILSENSDLALVWIDTPQHEGRIQFDRAEIGESVIILGAPLALFPYVTTGIISFDGPESRIMVGNPDESDAYYWTDAVVTSGSSGGPMFNNEGYLLGICSFFVGYAHELRGFIRSEEILEFIEEVK